MEHTTHHAINWFEIPVRNLDRAPAADGTLVYLNAKPSLDAVLARVEAAGGRITTPKVQLPGDTGCFAHITDTEGNRVGLHAPA